MATAGSAQFIARPFAIAPSMAINGAVEGSFAFANSDETNKAQRLPLGFEH